MSSSNVPAIQFTPTGLVLPTEAQILVGVQADQQAAFGDALDPGLNTPQGQLASSETAIIGAKNDLFAQYVNQVDPAYSAGRMQDAIGRIYFLERKPATPTVATVTVSGLVGTTVPAGFLAIDPSTNNRYANVNSGVIGSGGTVSLEFACLVYGPILLAPSSLQVYQQQPGIDSLTNPGAGITGSAVESRNDFEYRRAQSVAMNGKASVQAIYGAVFNVTNVIDCYVTENTTGSPSIVGPTSYSLAAHSVYVAAVGGTDADVANAIWVKKDLGCDMNGNTTVTVYDTSYPVPQPSYDITFERPAATPVLFDVQIITNPNLPGDIVTLVQNAIINAFNGGDGGSRARIGSTIFASRFYAPVILIDPANIGIASLQVGLVTANAASVTMGIDQAPTITSSDITVTLV